MRKLIVPLLCLSLLAPSLPAAPASAAPFAAPAAAAHGGVALARWWGRGPGPLGIFGAIVAGTLVAAAISEHRARHEDMEHCAADFRSFDPPPAPTSTATGASACAPISTDRALDRC